MLKKSIPFFRYVRDRGRQGVLRKQRSKLFSQMCQRKVVKKLQSETLRFSPEHLVEVLQQPVRGIRFSFDAFVKYAVAEKTQPGKVLLRISVIQQLSNLDHHADYMRLVSWARRQVGAGVCR